MSQPRGAAEFPQRRKVERVFQRIDPDVIADVAPADDVGDLKDVAHLTRAALSNELHEGPRALPLFRAFAVAQLRQQLQHL